MPISDTPSVVTLLGDGAQTSWPFAFPLHGASDLAVVLTDPDGLESEAGAGAFSVTINPDGVGGTVTYPLSGSPLATGHKITLVRRMVFEQQVSFGNQGGVQGPTVARALDRLTMFNQELKETLARAVTVPVSSDESPANYLATLDGYRDDASASAAAAAVSQASASAQASAAATSRAAADADAAATAADRIQVASDRAAVATDAAAANADRLAADADATATAADRTAVAADKIQVATDKAAVAADKATTQGYRDAAAASATSAAGHDTAAAASASAAYDSEVAAAASAAAANAAASGGAVKVSAGDTASDYLVNTLVAGSNIQLTVINAGANETLRLSVTGLAAVATSGAYADLSGKPSLGTAAALDAGNAAANLPTVAAMHAMACALSV